MSRDRLRVLSLHEEGLSYRLIARNVGLSKNTVMDIVQRHLIASKKAASGRAAALLAVQDGAAFNIAHAARITRAPTKLGLTSAHSWGTANREI